MGVPRRRVDNLCPIFRWLPRIIVFIGFLAGVVTLIVAIIEAIFFSEAGTAPAWPCFLGVIVEFGYFGLVAYIVSEVLLFFGCSPMSYQDIARLIPRRND